jgi:hypothetical protein
MSLHGIPPIWDAARSLCTDVEDTFIHGPVALHVATAPNATRAKWIADPMTSYRKQALRKTLQCVARHQ